MQYEHNELMSAAREYIGLMKESGLGYFRIKNDKFEIELLCAFGIVKAQITARLERDVRADVATPHIGKDSFSIRVERGVAFLLNGRVKTQIVIARGDGFGVRAR